MKEYDIVKKEFIEKLYPNSSLATDIWLDKVDWRSYVYKEKPTVQAHLKEVARQAAIQKPPDADADDGDYTPLTENKTSRNIVLETNRVTVIDYFDHLEKQLVRHLLHRNLVSSEHISKKNYERNSRPWTVQRDIDFSENGSIENFDKIQPDH